MLIAGRTIQPVYSYALDGSYQEEPRPDIPLPQIAEDTYILSPEFNLFYTPITGMEYGDSEVPIERYVRMLGLLTNLNLEGDHTYYVSRLEEELDFLRSIEYEDPMFLRDGQLIGTSMIGFEISSRLYELGYINLYELRNTVVHSYNVFMTGGYSDEHTDGWRMAERSIGYGVNLEEEIFRDLDYILSEEFDFEKEDQIEMVDIIRVLTVMLEHEIRGSDVRLDRVLTELFTWPRRDVIHVLTRVYEWSSETYGNGILPRPILSRLYYLLNEVNFADAVLLSDALVEMGVEDADVLLQRSFQIRDREVERIFSLELDPANPVQIPILLERQRETLEPEPARDQEAIRRNYDQALENRDYIFAVNYAKELIQAEYPEALQLLEQAGNQGFEYFMNRQRYGEAFFIAEQMHANGVEQGPRMIAESGRELYQALILSNQAVHAFELLERIIETGIDEPEVREIRELHSEYLEGEYRIDMDQCRYADAIERSRQMTTIQVPFAEENMRTAYEALFEHVIEEGMTNENMRAILEQTIEDGLPALTLNFLGQVYEEDSRIGNKILTPFFVAQMRQREVEGLDLWLAQRRGSIFERDNLLEKFKLAHTMYELGVEGSYELLERYSTEYVDRLLSETFDITAIDVVEVMREANIPRANEYWEIVREHRINELQVQYHNDFTKGKYVNALLEAGSLLELEFPQAETLAQQVLFLAYERYIEGLRSGQADYYSLLGVFKRTLEDVDAPWSRDLFRRFHLINYQWAMNNRNDLILATLSGQEINRIDPELGRTMIVLSFRERIEESIERQDYEETIFLAERIINIDREFGADAFLRIYRVAQEAEDYEQAFQISNAMVRLRLPGALGIANKAFRNLPGYEDTLPVFEGNGYRGITHTALEIALELDIRNRAQFIFNGIRYTLHISDQELSRGATFSQSTRCTDVILYRDDPLIIRSFFHEIIEDQLRREFGSHIIGEDYENLFGLPSDFTEFTEHSIAFGLEDEFFPQRVAVNGHGLNLLYTISAESIDPDIVIDMIFRNSFSRSEELSNRSRYPNLENEQRTSDIRTHIREGLRGPRSGESAGNYIERILERSEQSVDEFEREQRMDVNEARRTRQRIRSLRETREPERWRREILRR